MTPVSHGKPCAGNPHARFDEGASASEEPRRKALLHIDKDEKIILSGEQGAALGSVMNASPVRICLAGVEMRACGLAHEARR